MRMHGDADAETITPVVIPDIELINGTEPNYEMVNVFQYLYEKVDELNDDAGGYHKDIKWDTIDIDYLRKLSRYFNNQQDDDSLIAWFSDNVWDMLEWEWDVTSEYNYRASFQGFNTYYFDGNGTRYTFTEEYTSKFV